MNFFDTFSVTFLIRLLVSAVLGAAIGMERDLHGRAAGVRTHLLVCTGATLFTLVSLSIGESPLVGSRNCDAARIAAQIVSGIGFLGAGMIIRNRLSIRGLTTAACLWMVAAIGMAVALGMYVVSVMTTCAVIIALCSLKNLERKFRRNYQLHITLRTRTVEELEELHIFLKSLPQYTIDDFSIHFFKDNYVEAELVLDTVSRQRQSELTSSLGKILAQKKDLILSCSMTCEG